MFMPPTLWFVSFNCITKDMDAKKGCDHDSLPHFSCLFFSIYAIFNYNGCLRLRLSV